MYPEIIDGVETKALKVIADERGRLMEMLRTDDQIFEEFGQVYLSTTYPGVVKGWHSHQEQTDNIICVRGMIKLVIYDNRPGSCSKGRINEFFIGEHHPVLVKIPPRLHHGWKCIGRSEAYIINVASRVYNYDQPDEIRVNPHQNDIPYDWSRQDG